MPQRSPIVHMVRPHFQIHLYAGVASIRSSNLSKITSPYKKFRPLEPGPVMAHLNLLQGSPTVNKKLSLLMRLQPEPPNQARSHPHWAHYLPLIRMQIHWCSPILVKHHTRPKKFKKIAATKNNNYGTIRRCLRKHLLSHGATSTP